jgi:hypothetical protein
MSITATRLRRDGRPTAARPAAFRQALAESATALPEPGMTPSMTARLARQLDRTTAALTARASTAYGIAYDNDHGYLRTGALITGDLLDTRAGRTSDAAYRTWITVR